MDPFAEQYGLNLGPLGVWRHPVAVLFHILFKAGALVFYILSSAFGADSFVMIFIVSVLLLAFDFWTTKNVTGRLLVGLRWWSKVQDDGSEEWHFESHDDESLVDAKESRVFWFFLFVTPVIWTFMGLVALFRMEPTSLLIVFTALGLSGSNIYGYVKCAKHARDSLSSFATRFIGNAALDSVLSGGAGAGAR